MAEFLKSIFSPNGERGVPMQESSVDLLPSTRHLRAEIDGRQQMEMASAELAAIVTFSDDAIIGKDLNGIITSWNAGAEKIFGYSTGEIVGTSILRLIPPELQKEEHQILDKIRHGESVRHLETMRRTKDGRQIHVSITASPIKDSTGRIVGASKVVRDITENKLIQEALIASEVRYRRLFEAARDGILILDAETGMVVDVNPFLVQLLGYSYEVFLGKKVWELGVFKDIVANKAKFEQLQQQGTVRYENLPLEARDGRRIAVEFVSNVYQSGDGKVIQCNIRDITERKRAQDEKNRLHAELEEHVAARTMELATANKELEAFCYSVSHDLRAPLRGLDGFSQALIEDYSDQLGADGQNLLQRIRAGSQRMGQLIDDLLNLSRVSRSELRRETVNLSGIAGEVVEELREQDPERHVAVRIAEDLKADGDPQLLRVVLENLLGNAWKYTSKQPEATIEFGLSRENGDTSYFVRDDGVGFDMQYADKLFAPFQRLHGMTEFPGTGVGLATVQRIIHRHGGRVWVQAEVNKGATVYFTLS